MFKMTTPIPGVLLVLPGEVSRVIHYEMRNSIRKQIHIYADLLTAFHWSVKQLDNCGLHKAALEVESNAYSIFSMLNDLAHTLQ